MPTIREEALQPRFLAKAAPEIVEKDRAKLADLTDKLARLDARSPSWGKLFQFRITRDLIRRGDLGRPFSVS